MNKIFQVAELFFCCSHSEGALNTMKTFHAFFSKSPAKSITRDVNKWFSDYKVDDGCIPIELSDILANPYRCLWSGVVLMRYNFLCFGQSCALSASTFLRGLSSKVKVQLKRMAVGDGLIPFQSHQTYIKPYRPSMLVWIPFASAQCPSSTSDFVWRCCKLSLVIIRFKNGSILLRP